MSKKGIQSLALGRKDILRIDPYDLNIKEGWNCREVNFNPDDEDDLALAESIAEIGVKQPLTAIWEDGKAYITDGHRRLVATFHAIEVLRAEIKSVPVQTEDRYSSEAERVLSQLVRNNGKPLSTIEFSRVYKRLIDLGWTEKEIATKIGRSTKWVKSLLELNSAPAEVVELVRTNKVSASMALGEIKSDPSKAGERLNEAVTTAKAAGKSRATPKHLSSTVKPKSKAEKAFDALMELAETSVTISRDPLSSEWVLEADYGRDTRQGDDLIALILKGSGE